MTNKQKIFIKWLRNYDWGYIDEKTANKCINMLYTNASQDDKELCLDFLSVYENWKASQMKKMFQAWPHLNEYNQECLVDTQWAMFTEDLPPKAARQYVANEWMLLSKSQYPDAAEWAADDMMDFAHPYCMTKAINNFNNTKHRWRRYFARNWMDMWDLEYKEVKKWGKPKKAKWFEDTPDYLTLPKWCLGERPIYVYIFTVSNYPTKWGDISLPGCEKDNRIYQKMFREVANGGIDFYYDEQATNENYFKCIASMADKEDDAVHVFCNSHHGSWDIAGNHCQLLYDFEYDTNNKVFVNTPTSHKIHHAVDIACKKSPNILPIFIGDYCGSGGVATEKILKANNNSLKIKSFHPEGWIPPTIPNSYVEAIRRNSREIWMNACRPEWYSYDSPEGGVFTNAIYHSFKKSKTIGKIMKQAGKKIQKQGIPSVPWLVCGAGRQKFKFDTHNTKR